MKKNVESIAKKRAAVYIRVSTQEQTIEGYSIPAQKDRLSAYCKAHDWLISDFFIDGGYTGANIKRPGIQKLISEIEKFDVVLVYKLDRLSRSQRDTLYLIEEVFLPSGVDFVSMNESFDTSAPFGRAMIGILSVFAQLEREQIKERTFMGKLERAKGGLFHGGKFYPIGYDYVDGKLVVNEYEAAQVRNVYDWYLEGTSPEKIAERLRAEGYTNRYSSWISTSSVRSVLTSEVYLGKIRYGDVVVENAHEALVTREQFEKVKATMIKRREMFGDSAYKAKYLLSSLIFCARCGSRYFVKYNSGSRKNRRYYCYSRAKTAPQMAKAANCDNKIWKLNELDAIVSAEMKKLFESPAFLESLIAEREEANKNKPRKEGDIIRSKIKDYDAQISHLMDLYQNKDMPANVVSARIEKLYGERSALEEQLAKLRPMKAEDDFDMEVITQIIADAGAIWEQADISDKRQILQTFINRIVIDGENIKIEWAAPSHGTPEGNA